MNNILHALSQHALHTPERTAVSGRQTLNWRELYAGTTQLAAMLAGSRALGLHLANSPAWVMADLATMMAGIMNVPLPTFFSPAQLQHAMHDAQVDVIITDNPTQIAALIDLGGETGFDIAGMTFICLFPLNGKATVARRNTTKLTYTSGTTGAPRGVCLGEAAIEQVTGSLAAAAGARQDDRALALLPLSILLENIGSIYAPILAGAEMIVPDASELGISGSSRVDAEQLARALNHYRPTTLIVPPGLLKQLVALGQQNRLPDSFRFIAVGGAPTGSRLLASASELGLPVFQGYGLSEACSVISVNSPGDNRQGSVGKPLPHVRLRITPDNHILVAGAMADGYLNGADFDPGAYFDTGDTGYLDDDGFLYVTGRHRNRIITGYGRNISPEWVESELLAHPAIAQAAVLGDASGELTAVLVTTGAAQQPGEVLEAVNARLPDYARVARYTVADSPFCIERGELTANGAPVRDIIEQHYILPADRPMEKIA